MNGMNSNFEQSWESLKGNLAGLTFIQVEHDVKALVAGMSAADLVRAGDLVGVIVHGSKANRVRCFVRSLVELKVVIDQNRRPAFSA